MPPLRQDVARPLGAVLFLGIAVLHFQAVAPGFAVQPYLGVSLILGTATALGGVAGTLADDRDRIWWYALAEGLLTAAGYAVNRLSGLPLAGRDPGRWYGSPGARTLAFLGVLLAVLAAWTLLARFRRRRTRMPVTSAYDRDLMSIPRPNRSGE